MPAPTSESTIRHLAFSVLHFEAEGWGVQVPPGALPPETWAKATGSEPVLQKGDRRIGGAQVQSGRGKLLRGNGEKGALAKLGGCDDLCGGRSRKSLGR